MSSDQGGSERGMDWMYKGPNALVDREDYLLGRKVDKSFQMLEAAEKGNSAWLSEAEKDLTPQSILKVSGTSSGPIDVIRKIKDDPLYQIQKKEQEFRKQLMLNPILMKKLQQQHSHDPKSSNPSKSRDKEKKQKKSKKHKRKRDNNSSSSSNDSSDSSDEEVNKLLHKLKQSNDLSTLLESSSSKKKKNKRHDSSSSEEEIRHSRRRKESPRRHNRNRTKSRSPLPVRDINSRNRQYSPSTSTSGHYVQSSNYRKRETNRKPEVPMKKKLDEKEMELRRQEMMGNAKQRDIERQKVVEKHRDEIKKEHEMLEKHRKEGKDATFIKNQLVEAANTGSVEQRVKSNAYNIQRSKFAMDKNFARR